MITVAPLQRRHNEQYWVSNHCRLRCLFNRVLRPRSKKISILRAIGLCEGNSPLTGEFPAQRANNAENVSIDFVIIQLPGYQHYWYWSCQINEPLFSKDVLNDLCQCWEMKENGNMYLCFVECIVYTHNSNRRILPEASWGRGGLGVATKCK